MRIAVTGGPGFIGHYIVRRLASSGHSLRCWYRPTSNRSGLEDVAIEWLPGELNDQEAPSRWYPAATPWSMPPSIDQESAFAVQKATCIEFANRMSSGRYGSSKRHGGWC